MKSYKMNRDCPGCGKKHILFYEGTDTPSNLDNLKFICPSDDKTYRVVHRDIPVWQEEFSIPEGAIITTKLKRD